MTKHSAVVGGLPDAPGAIRIEHVVLSGRVSGAWPRVGLHTVAMRGGRAGNNRRNEGQWVDSALPTVGSVALHAGSWFSGRVTRLRS